VGGKRNARSTFSTLNPIDTKLALFGKKLICKDQDTGHPRHDNLNTDLPDLKLYKHAGTGALSQFSENVPKDSIVASSLGGPAFV
jgi:hypothetical protein